MAASFSLFLSLFLLPFFADTGNAGVEGIDLVHSINVVDGAKVDGANAGEYRLITPYHPNASTPSFTQKMAAAAAAFASPTFKRPDTATQRRLRGLTARSFLDGHNAIRARLRLPPLAWDRRLARYARQWAARVAAAGCSPRHSYGPYGENVFWGGGPAWTAADAVQVWASEAAFYNIMWNTCLPFKVCGHYTQVVWRSTRRVGCDRVICPGGDVFITCNYDPPGNYVGERPFDVTG